MSSEAPGLGTAHREASGKSKEVTLPIMYHSKFQYAAPCHDHVSISAKICELLTKVQSYSLETGAASCVWEALWAKSCEP